MPPENFLKVFKSLEKCLSNITQNISVNNSSPDFTRIKNQLDLLFSIETLSSVQREDVSVYLTWLFNELIYISVTAKEINIKTKEK